MYTELCRFSQKSNAEKGTSTTFWLVLVFRLSVLISVGVSLAFAFAVMLCVFFSLFIFIRVCRATRTSLSHSLTHSLTFLCFVCMKIWSSVCIWCRYCHCCCCYCMFHRKCVAMQIIFFVSFSRSIQTDTCSQLHSHIFVHKSCLLVHSSLYELAHTRSLALHFFNMLRLCFAVLSHCRRFFCLHSSSSLFNIISRFIPFDLQRNKP